jgi:hypothetical protein
MEECWQYIDRISNEDTRSETQSERLGHVKTIIEVLRIKPAAAAVRVQDAGTDTIRFLCFLLITR